MEPVTHACFVSRFPFSRRLYLSTAISGSWSRVVLPTFSISLDALLVCIVYCVLLAWSRTTCPPFGLCCLLCTPMYKMLFLWLWRFGIAQRACVTGIQRIDSWQRIMPVRGPCTYVCQLNTIQGSRSGEVRRGQSSSNVAEVRLLRNLSCMDSSGVTRTNRIRQ